MRHSAAAPPVRSVRAAGSPLFAVTVALALLSVGFFGYGVFLHTAAKPNLNAAAKPTPIVGAAHSKPLPHTRHSHHTVVGKPKSSPLSATTSPPTALFGLTGPGNDLAFGAMLAGGIGLLLSALAGLGLSHQTRTTQSQTIQSSLRAEYAAWEKQRSVLDTQREALSAQLQEAQQNKAEIDKLRHHASRQFQEFFRTLPVACFCFAADGKIVRWNAACETLYGLPASEAMDSTLWTSVVPADEREAMTEWMQRVLAGDSVLDVERRDQNSAGTTFPLRCSMVPLYGAEGEIIGGLSAGIDLSEIKQYTQHISALETALSQARTELSQIRAAWEAHTLETARLQSHLLEAAPQRVIEEIADAAAPSRDLLTGLYTQEAFQDRLRAEAERAHRYKHVPVGHRAGYGWVRGVQPSAWLRSGRPSPSIGRVSDRIEDPYRRHRRTLRRGHLRPDPAGNQRGRHARGRRPPPLRYRRAGLGTAALDSLLRGRPTDPRCVFFRHSFDTSFGVPAAREIAWPKYGRLSWRRAISCHPKKPKKRDGRSGRVIRNQICRAEIRLGPSASKGRHGE